MNKLIADNIRVNRIVEIGQLLMQAMADASSVKAGTPLIEAYSAVGVAFHLTLKDDRASDVQE